MCNKIYFPRSGLACNFCTELNLFMCAFFRASSLSFEGDNFNCCAGLAQWRGLTQTLHSAIRSNQTHVEKEAMSLSCVLYLCFSFLLFHFHPIFVLFVTISAVLFHCFNAGGYFGFQVTGMIKEFFRFEIFDFGIFWIRKFGGVFLGVA